MTADSALHLYIYHNCQLEILSNGSLQNDINTGHMKFTYQTYNLWLNMTYGTNIGTISTCWIKFTTDAVGAKFVAMNSAWTNF